MTRLVVIFLLALLQVGQAHSQDTAVIREFDEGTAALVDGRFHDALRAFESVESTGWASDALFYNMGLAHYRLDHLGQAIRYLEKAKWLNEDDERVLHSLNVAQSRQTDRFSTLPDPVWKNIQQWLVDTVPVRVAFLIGILCWFGFVGGWTVKTLAHHDSEWLRRGRWIALVLGLALIVHALASSVWPAYPDRAVVLSDQLTLHEQASSDAAEVIQVHEGLVVEVRAASPDWSFVEIPNGTRGWVPTPTLGDI